MAEDKLDRIIEELQTLKTGQQALERRVQGVDDRVQGLGVQVEGLRSDIKAVAEGHAVIRREMNEGFENADKKIDGVERKLDAHLRILHAAAR